MQLQLLEARGHDDFDSAFAAMAKERVGALLVLVDSMFPQSLLLRADEVIQ